ncbi:class I SAM-dependent methyltransferase [Micromonospora sp. M12]
MDLDPALLAIADASLAGRATLVRPTSAPRLARHAPHREYDAVLTATALHWLPADRLGQLYAELRDVLRPGGVFVNADHMPDDTLPELTKRLLDRARDRRNARYAAGSMLSWSDWWERAGADPALAPLVAERQTIYPPGTARVEPAGLLAPRRPHRRRVQRGRHGVARWPDAAVAAVR